MTKLSKRQLEKFDYQLFDRLFKDKISSILPFALSKLSIPYTGKFESVESEIHFPHKKIGDAILKVYNSHNTSQFEIIHLEFQSYNDVNMLKRMYLTSGGILDKMNQLPIQIVIYFGASPCTMIDNVANQKVHFSYDIIDLGALPVNNFLENDDPNIATLATVCRVPDKIQLFSDITDNILQRKQDFYGIKKHLEDAHILSKLCKLDIPFLEIMTSKVKEQFKLENIHLLLDSDVENVKAEGISLGKAEGISLGKAEGISLGKAELLHNIVINMLGQGYKTDEIAKILKQDIQSIENSINLGK